MSKAKPVKEQVVVVFGASSGIGRATAQRFAAKGAKVVVVARREEGLDSLVAEIAQGGGEAVCLVADASRYDEVEMVARETVALYGRIDSWAHVAAVSIYATVADTTVEEFRQVIETNLMGIIHGAKAALPHLKQVRGTFLPVTSVEAEVPLPYQAAYASSKHGAHGFLKVLRLELAKEGNPAYVAEIMPASIDTPFFDKAKTKIGVVPMGIPPVYPPEMVADAIVRAAEHPQPQVIVGGAGKAMVAGERLAPSMTEAVIGLIGFQGQKTTQPKDADAPSNLYAPLSGPDDAKVRGGLGPVVLASKALPWVLAGVALGAVAAVGGWGRPPQTRTARYDATSRD